MPVYACRLSSILLEQQKSEDQARFKLIPTNGLFASSPAIFLKDSSKSHVIYASDRTPTSV